MKSDDITPSRCAIGILGSLVLTSLLSTPALGQIGGPFSGACDKLRRDAIREYWRSTVSPDQVRRMENIVGDNPTVGAGLVSEALAGRITIQQLGASSLAGLDAVEMSAVCGERDRQAAKRMRLLLPGLMLYTVQKLDEGRRVK